MKKGCVLIGVLALLGACAQQEDPGIQLAGSDTACNAVASARSRDAGLNGYDWNMQVIIWREAYNSCVLGKPGVVIAERSPN
jgi:hypothetical protein